MKKNKKAYFAVKRLTDIIFSLTGIIIFFIPVILIALLIYINTGSPVFYYSNRTGKNNRCFRMVKLRTMKNGTPELSQIHLKDSDKYLITLGKFLRTTGIDELPQLFNILLGDMSIVGPRPVVIDDRETIDLRNKNNIFTIKPGLTGLAQVNGRHIPIEQKIHFDTLYMKKMCFLLDIKIIFLTNFCLFYENFTSQQNIKLNTFTEYTELNIT